MSIIIEWLLLCSENKGVILNIYLVLIKWLTSLSSKFFQGQKKMFVLHSDSDI